MYRPLAVTAIFVACTHKYNLELNLIRPNETAVTNFLSSRWPTDFLNFSYSSIKSIFLY